MSEEPRPKNRSELRAEARKLKGGGVKIPKKRWLDVQNGKRRS